MTIKASATPNFARRRGIDGFMRGLTVVATSLAIVPLLLIIGYVVVVGGSALSIEFFTQDYLPPVVADPTLDPTLGLVDPTLDPSLTDPNAAPAGEGEQLGEVTAQGGVRHGIVGTLLIAGTALLISMPIGILAGVFLSEYRDNIVAQVVRFCTDVLSGAPSIIAGVAVYVLIVQQFRTFAGIAGSIALVVLMVPTITRTTEEILKLVPDSIREAALALGAPNWYSTFTVVIPTALAGIATGVLLAFARGAGETAPLLLTVLGNNNLSFDMLAPMAALPLLTYRYTESPFPSENNLAWGTAFVLMTLVLLVNILVRVATRRSASLR